MHNERILIGKIKSAHGIKGLIKVEYYGENDPDTAHQVTFFTDNKDNAQISVQFKSRQNTLWLASIAHVDNRGTAEQYKGTPLYINRSSLPSIEPDNNNDQFYIADLIGMTLVNTNGQKTGLVTSVENYGAGDLLFITYLDGQKILIPFTKEYFPDIFMDQNIIVHADISDFAG